MTRLCEPICLDRPTDCFKCAEDLTPEQILMAYEGAEALVHEALGRRYGICSDTIEMCVGGCCVGSCYCDDCRRVKIIVGDRMPLRTITSATVTPHPTDAVPIPVAVAIAGLQIRDFNEITFPASYKTFPEGIIRITFTYGKPFPVGTCIAVRQLAEQLVSAISCNCECTLPSNIQSFAKGDIQYGFISAQVLSELHLTGIPALDNLIRVFGRYKRPTVYSPDIHKTDCGRWYRVTGIA